MYVCDYCGEAFSKSLEWYCMFNTAGEFSLVVEYALADALAAGWEIDS